MPENSLILRDAEDTDVLVLAAIRSSEALHQGRLRDARNLDLRYLVILLDRTIIGFVSLVFRRPVSWANASDTTHLPQIVDLYIAETWRGQGYGTQTIHQLEDLAAQSGYAQLYLSVDPFVNARAYTLYQRLGYKRIQQEPYFHHWQAMNADGTMEQGKSWLVDMVKVLQGE